MAQISARLSAQNRALFEEYAKAVGLDAAELARLLIVREIRMQRAVHDPTASAANQSTAKLTAHFHDPADVEKFDRHATANGMSRAAAAKKVFERELTEMWLLRALEWSPSADTNAPSSS